MGQTVIILQAEQDMYYNGKRIELDPNDPGG